MKKGELFAIANAGRSGALSHIPFKQNVIPTRYSESLLPQKTEFEKVQLSHWKKTDKTGAQSSENPSHLRAARLFYCIKTGFSFPMALGKGQISCMVNGTFFPLVHLATQRDAGEKTLTAGT